jgi:hypothetical protein
MDQLKATPTETAVTEPSPNVSFSYAQQLDEQVNNELKALGRFFLKHPSLAFTFGYLIASVMGMIFTISLLDQFEFNAFPYLELSDFLLAAVAHPQTVLHLLIGIAAVVFVFWFDRLCRGKSPKYAAWIDKYYSSTSDIPNWVWGLITFVFYLYFTSISQTPKLSLAVKNQQTVQYQLSLIYPIEPGGKEQRTLEQVQIITRTVSYLWVYHQQQVKLIPHSNVAALIPLLSQQGRVGAKTEKTAPKLTEKPAEAEKAAEKTPAAAETKS